MPASTTSLICATAICGMAAMLTAIARADARVSASATTSLTRPMRSASSAVTWQPVNNMRSAWNLPTARTSR
ncbi:hypothetical protein D3C86_1824240 [compost metagenome]